MAKKYIETWDTTDGSQQQAAPIGTLNSILVSVVASKIAYIEAPADGKVIGARGYITGGAAGPGAQLDIKDKDGNTIGDTGTALNAAADGTVFIVETIDDDYNTVSKGDRVAIVTAAGTQADVVVEFALL